MYIALVKNNGVPYLKLMQSYRPEGSSRPTSKVVYNIGPYSRYVNDANDMSYLEKLRESFRAGKPIITELEQFVEIDPNTGRTSTKPDVLWVSYQLQGNDVLSTFSPKLLADLLFNSYMDELGLSQTLRLIKSERRIQYDLLGFAKLLIYGRILNPASKWATLAQNERYYTPLLKDGYNPYNVYDTLDLIYENQERIFKRINKKLQERPHGRKTSTLFYDVSNFYFEIGANDADILDANGVVVEEGLRKSGHSKESRSEPIVQMGLFMDEEAVPIGIKVFPGNTVDKSSLVRAVSAVIDPMGYERFVYCADRGLCTAANLAYLVNQGMGYLLSKSIKKSKKEERDWIIQPEGYTEIRDKEGKVEFKHKSRIVKRSYVDHDGHTAEYQEKVVVFWSLACYKKGLHEMKKFSDFLKKLESETKSFSLSSSQIRMIWPYLKDEVIDHLDPDNDPPKDQTDTGKAAIPQDLSDPTGTGTADTTDAPTKETTTSATGGDEKTTNKSLENDSSPAKKEKRHKLTQEEKDQREAAKKAEAARKKSLKESRKKRLTEQLKSSDTTRKMIDWEKVNRYKDYVGYYQIVTTEVERSDQEIIESYRELTQIEDRFRTMKGTLETRPIYCRTKEHIEAHLVICAIALIIFALIQNRYKQIVQKGKNLKWYLGISPDRIQNALNVFEVSKLRDNYVMFRNREEDDAGRDLQKLLNAFDISIENRVYSAGEIRTLRGNVKVLN